MGAAIARARADSQKRWPAAAGDFMMAA